jgi:ribonuclease Z
MRRWPFVVAGALAVLFAAGWIALEIPSVDIWLFREGVTRLVVRPDPTIAGPNELAVALCGTGSPLPDVTRAGPCTLIGAGEHLYVVDSGIDSARNLLLWRVPLEKIDGVFITHLHSDHIGELGELRLQTWVAGRRTPLKVYGPPGIERVVAGFNEAYAIDSFYRTAHHGADFLPPAAADMVAVVIDLGSALTGPAFDANGLKVTAIRVNHGPVKPAYGYRFDFAGRSVTVSGDTAADENLAHAAKGSDILVHEGLAPKLVRIFEDATLAAGRPRSSKIFHDIPGYHTAPVDAARIANEAQVKLLVFTHLLPILPNRVAETAFLDGVSDVRPDGVVLGHDGWIARLPGGSDAIETDELK